MSSKTTLLAIAVATASAFAAQPAFAGQDLGGKPVPGVCMLSREAVIANSKVGKYANHRVQELAQQARAELAKERKPLAADIQSFRSKAASMSAADRKKNAEALQKRMQAFQGRARELTARIQRTRAAAMQRIGGDVQPILASVYKHKGCGLLLDRDSVLGGNTENDLTPDVVHGLDKKVTSIKINLVKLPSSNGNK